VSLAGKNVELSPQEFNLLHALAIEPNRFRSVDELLATVAGGSFSLRYTHDL
jgi:DNA-binding response OmpR family regulator